MTENIAKLKCPHCGAEQKVEIPTRSCLPFHKCAKCGKMIVASKGLCCVICAYGNKLCHVPSKVGLKYGYKKEAMLPFKDAVKRIREDLKKEGFGVITEIDVRATLRGKLGIDFDKYIILGVCNPPYALKALMADRDIGLMLPCNVILYEQKGRTFVAAILPTKFMKSVDNPELGVIAEKIEAKLKKVIDLI
jgi:uncharacterized protein (DUF302 family)